MGQVRLGKLLLNWCDKCNLPVLAERECGSCGWKTRKVTLTPPGDIRPARNVDIERVRALANAQFGPGSGHALVPDDDAVIVLNKAPAEDRMDEVIMDGEVVATMRYVPLLGWRLLPRLSAAARISKVATRGIVQLAEDAVPFIEGGASVLAPGVEAASDSIQSMEDVVVIDPRREVVGVGTARMTGIQMVEEERGVCVKVRHRRRTGQVIPEPGPVRTWDEALEANRAHMERMVEAGGEFALRIAEEQGKPIAVSYSGGKDSLATLLIVLDAGIRPPVVFVDTGIELPETVEHVHEVARRHGLELIVEESGQDFVVHSGRFGPPSRDYRWCCKTQKLGPVARALNTRFPGGVTTFIGQRRYESGPRSRSGNVWMNPWVPGQVGASPIQNWTALHVWLYLRMRNEAVNPWYDLGLERIGCYPCPASDLADMEVVEENFPGYARWKTFLEEYARATGRDPLWVDLGLWRFRRMPKSLREFAGDTFDGDPALAPALAISFQVGEAVAVKENHVEVRGAFDRSLDLDRAAELLTVLGPTVIDQEAGVVRVGDAVAVTATSDGTITAEGRGRKEALALLEQTRQLIVKAELCVGCGVCVPRCSVGALATADGRVHLDVEECVHCGSCFGPCAVVDFPPHVDPVDNVID